MFIASKGFSFRTYFIFTAAGVVPCGGRKRLPVHHHSADYIFSGPFGSVGSFILSQFENRVPLKPVLGDVGSVAPLHYCTRTDTIKPSLLFSFLMCSLLTKGVHSALISIDKREGCSLLTLHLHILKRVLYKYTLPREDLGKLNFTFIKTKIYFETESLQAVHFYSVRVTS